MALCNEDDTGMPFGERITPSFGCRISMLAPRFSEILRLKWILASVGGVGDAYDNALAETTIGLFITEVMAKNNPIRQESFKTITDEDYANKGWVNWYNLRLHTLKRSVPPVEFEANYCAATLIPLHALSHTRPVGCLNRSVGSV